MKVIKEMPVFERPREKADLYGVKTLSNRELLALLIGSGVRGQNALETADLLLDKAQGIQGIPKMSRKELCSVRGISDARAVTLLACYELARRSSFETMAEKKDMSDIDKVGKWLQKEIGSQKQEQFTVIFLDAKLRMTGFRTMFRGTVNMSSVYPREIFREAMERSSTGIILAHNHPSGELTPSRADLGLTGELIILGNMMQVEVLDHFIVSQSGYLSFKAEYLMHECVELASLKIENIDNFL